MNPEIEQIHGKEFPGEYGMLFVRTDGIIDTMIRIPLLVASLIIVVAIIPIQPSFSSPRNLDLIIYPDGTTHVSTEIDVDPLSIDYELNLFGSTIDNFVAINENGFLLNHEIRGNSVFIETFASSIITVEYDIHDLVSKQGRFWTFSLDSPSDFTLLLPKNSAITLDAGTLCLQATDSLEYYDPPSLFTPLDFGLVGFSFACGLGVKLAKPNKTVVSLMGDGGFGMTISELSTAVEYKINTITIVLNNKSWGAEKAYQKDFYGKRYLGADISSPRFDKVAELYGAKGFKVTKISEINRTLKAALKIRKPVVIDVDVDPKALYSFRRDSFKHRIK